MRVKNLVIWLAPNAINALGQHKLPVRAALAVAKLGVTLADLRRPIEAARVALLDQHTVKGADGKPEQEADGSLKLTDKEAWNKAFNELMEADCETDMVVPKVKLPEMVAGTCDKCKHNMDRTLEIEPVILQQLEPFIEV